MSLTRPTRSDIAIEDPMKRFGDNEEQSESCEKSCLSARSG